MTFPFGNLHALEYRCPAVRKEKNMQITIVTVFLILLTATPVAVPDGLVNIPSSFAVEETANRMGSALREKGMTIFNRI